MRCCDALVKYRADPARDAQRLTELKPQEQRQWP
jgi:ATP-dependent helicase HrpA